MEPITIIIWTSVFVFSATSLLTILHLAGFLPNFPQEYSNWLFRILIVQIVVASVAVFVNLISNKGGLLKIPVEEVMLIEQGSFLEIYDGMTPLYLRSSRVSRANGIANISISESKDFLNAKSFNLKPEEVHENVVNNKKYLFSYSKMGTLDRNPSESDSRSTDFILLSVKLPNS